MPTKNHYDTLVLGTGGIGSACLYHLAQQGQCVAGIDRFSVAHDRGSSHGHTRLIRQSYFEHPSYVPIVQRAFELWENLQVEHGRQLYYETGILEAGPADGELIPGVLASSQTHQLPIEQMDIQTAQQRWPQFRFAENHEVIFEQRGGYLLVEHAIAAHIEKAQWAGAELFIGHSIQEIETAQDVLVVHTDRDRFTAHAVVITAGAWAADLLPELKGHLQILRKPLHWFAADPDLYSQRAGCPSFMMELETGFFYGFPSTDERGLKVAQHTGGLEIQDPLVVDLEVNETERNEVQVFLQNHLPQVNSQPTAHAVCMYTKTADSHFVIDRAAADDRIVYAAGLSGHGFKFASALGEILADMALGKDDRFDLSPFQAARPLAHCSATR